MYIRGALATTARWRILPGRLLPRFGRYVQDDWNTLVFFRVGTDHKLIDKVAHDLLLGKRDAFLKCHDAHACVHNWDGVYWEVFSKDEELLSWLLRAHVGDPHLAIYWVEFEDDFPTPRDVPLKSAGLPAPPQLDCDR